MNHSRNVHIVQIMLILIYRLEAGLTLKSSASYIATNKVSLFARQTTHSVYDHHSLFFSKDGWN
jgi:hypothetical protein